MKRSLFLVLPLLLASGYGLTHQSKLFRNLTGVYPRQTVQTVGTHTEFTFTIDGQTYTPPSLETLQRIGQLHPAFDEKWQWRLLENPALPLMVKEQTTDADSFYYALSQQLLENSQKASVSPYLTVRLAEVHLGTLQNGFWNSETQELRDFNENEITLTDKQQLIQTLAVDTLLEPVARLFLLEYTQRFSSSYADTGKVSTTITQGRLPLPTPIAAEDTPGVHALSVLAAPELFPEPLVRAAQEYADQYRHYLKRTSQIQSDLLVSQPIDFEAYSFKDITYQQMFTGSQVGLIATRLEGYDLNQSWRESFEKAKDLYRWYYQTNPAGLSQAELTRQHRLNTAEPPNLRPVIDAEKAFFLQVQAADMDISMSSFTTFTPALAKRLDNLLVQRFRPDDPDSREWQLFAAAIMPALRDMPDLEIQAQGLNEWGANYVVPDLMALTPEQSPTITHLAALYETLNAGGIIQDWDYITLFEIVSTAITLGSGWDPALIHPDHQKHIPVVQENWVLFRRLLGSSGSIAVNWMHGQSGLDFRNPKWPEARKPQAIEVPDKLLYDNATVPSLNAKLLLTQRPKFIERGGDIHLINHQGEELITNLRGQKLYDPIRMTYLVVEDRTTVEQLNARLNESIAIYLGALP